jgi:hypothetical protein
MNYFVRFKKQFIIAGIALALLAVGAGTSSAVWAYAKKAPERFLYKSLVRSLNFDGISVEVPAGGGDSASSEGIVKADGTVRFKANMACTADTANFGRLSVKLSAVQIQQEIYMRIDEAHVSGTAGDKETAQKLNDYLTGKVSGKWLLIEAADAQALAVKEYGIAFDLTGAMSAKQSEQSIIDKLQAHQVITILSSKTVKTDGKPAIEYNLRVSSTQYRNFIDDVQPGFKYTDKIISSLFDGEDTRNVTVVIDASSGKILYKTYDIPNVCGIFASSLDSSANGYSPTIKLKNFTKPGNDVPGIEKPSPYLTQLQFMQLLSGN